MMSNVHLKPLYDEDEDARSDVDSAQIGTKYYVSGVEVYVVSECVEYYGSEGQLVTEGLKDFTRRNILGEYDTLDHFLRAWKEEDRKQAIIEELKGHGVLLEELRRETGAYELSDFDLICHIAYDARPLTRSERAKNVKQSGYFTKYEGVAKEVLEALLDKYSTANLVDLDDLRVLSLEEFHRFGSPMKIAKAFGGRSNYIRAARELEDAIYAA